MAWIVIKKSDLSIIAMSGASADMVSGGTTYDPTLADFCAERSLVEADHSKIEHSDLDIIRYGAEISENAGVFSAVAKSAPVPQKAKKLVVSTDATDTVVPNGIPDIAADGVSTCNVTFQVQEEANIGAGDFVNKAEADVAVAIKTTGGRLSSRLVNTDANGAAAVVLTSSLDTIDVTVNGTCIYGSAEIVIEFA